MIRWADPERVGRAVRDHAEALRRRDPGITRVLWYGSWVNGIPTPGSDVDPCVVLADDGLRENALRTRIVVSHVAYYGRGSWLREAEK